MPWLIKNEDVIQLEQNFLKQRSKKKKKETNTSDPTTTTTTTTLDTTTTTTSPNHNNIPSSSSTIVGTTTTTTSCGESLFFIHIPRCGGTSLMHYYHLPTKIYIHYKYNYWKQLGMYTFFSRYKTLELYNFPLWTSGNGFAVAIIIVGIYFMIDTKNNYIPYNLGFLLILFGISLFILLTIIFTAPVIGRFPFVHHAYLIFVHYILCQFMECTTYCTGTNKTGYIMHLTAHKLLYTYEYVTIPQWNISCSMAIIRNPYSRMISIYTYNRFGEWESFTHFIQDWYNNVCQYYRATKECNEWYTPCHAIPQFEYTHYNGQPLVKSIIKQEELKYLKEIYKNNNTNNEENLEVEEPIMTTTTTATGQDTSEMGPTTTTTTTTTSLPPPTTIISNPSWNNTTTDDDQSSSIQNLPSTVRDALMNMPHSNQRILSKGKWYDYYTQETLNLVYEIYYEDFNYFHYNPILVQRPDLLPPSLYNTLYQPHSTTATTGTKTSNNTVNTVSSNNNNTLNGGDIEMGSCASPSAL